MSDSSDAASAGSRRARPAAHRRRPGGASEATARDVPGEKERVHRRRRVRPRDDDKKKIKVEDEESGDEDDKKTKSSSSSSSTTTTTTASTTSATSTVAPSSSATTTTLAPPPPPPPPATTPSPALITPPQAVTTAAPTTSSTPPAAAKTTAPLSTLSSQTTPAPTSTAASLPPGQAQTQTDGSGRAQAHRGPSTEPATVAFAVIGSLAAVSLIAFFLWRWGRRRRRARDDADAATEKQYFPPKSDIRIMDEAMAAVYSAEGGSGGGSSIEEASSQRGGSRWSNSTPGWFRRQVNKVTGSNSDQQEQTPARPKEAAVNKWMDRHTSRMLDPMAARASFVSSAPSDLGPPPSISPASVVGGNRESVLSEMGQIRRAAVPPPLDLAMVDRVKRMQEEEMAREQGQEGAAMARGRGQSQGDLGMEALAPPPPIGGGGYAGGAGSPSVYSPGRTEITWNTWGLDQHAKR